MLGKCWNGLIQHAIDGWNIGTPPYGYMAERHRYPAGIKAAQNRTRTRLVPDPEPDPERGPVVALIFDWRVNRRLSVPTIAWKLNGDPDAYPPPGNAPGWAESTVSAILRNPKYTGYMVFGRTRKDPATGRTRPVPPSQWTWSPEPTHEPLTPLATWQAAQATGAERGNVRDSEKPTAQPGSRYMLRSRIRPAVPAGRAGQFQGPGGGVRGRDMRRDIGACLRWYGYVRSRWDRDIGDTDQGGPGELAARAARRVAGCVHRPRPTGHVDLLAVGEGGHLRDRDHPAAAAAQQGEGGPVERRPEQVGRYFAVALTGFACPRGVGVRLVDPHLRACLPAGLLREPGVIGVAAVGF